MCVCNGSGETKTPTRMNTKTVCIRCVRSALLSSTLSRMCRSSICKHAHTHKQTHVFARTLTQTLRDTHTSAQPSHALTVACTGNFQLEEMCSRTFTPGHYQLYANLIMLNKQSDQAHTHTFAYNKHTYVIHFHVTEWQTHTSFFCAKQTNLESCIRRDPCTSWVNRIPQITHRPN